jgi:hypothetical protein
MSFFVYIPNWIFHKYLVKLGTSARHQNSNGPSESISSHCESNFLANEFLSNLDLSEKTI